MYYVNHLRSTAILVLYPINNLNLNLSLDPELRSLEAVEALLQQESGPPSPSQVHSTLARFFSQIIFFLYKLM